MVINMLFSDEYKNSLWDDNILEKKSINDVEKRSFGNDMQSALPCCVIKFFMKMHGATAQ